MIGFADQNTGFENRNQRDNIEFKVEFLIRLGDVTKCSQIERDFVCRTVFETFCRNEFYTMVILPGSYYRFDSVMNFVGRYA